MDKEEEDKEGCKIKRGKKFNTTNALVGRKEGKRGRGRGWTIEKFLKK